MYVSLSGPRLWASVMVASITGVGDCDVNLFNRIRHSYCSAPRSRGFVVGFILSQSVQLSSLKSHVEFCRISRWSHTFDPAVDFEFAVSLVVAQVRFFSQ